MILQALKLKMHVCYFFQRVIDNPTVLSRRLDRADAATVQLFSQIFMNEGVYSSPWYASKSGNTDFYMKYALRNDS